MKLSRNVPIDITKHIDKPQPKPKAKPKPKAWAEVVYIITTHPILSHPCAHAHPHPHPHARPAQSIHSLNHKSD